MSQDQQLYQLSIQQFLSRFRNSKKLDDIFSRGYTLSLDSQNNTRTILKFYSIETKDQEQAVLQSTHTPQTSDLLNFTKLNQVAGICKLLAYAIAETGTELISAFEYHPLTLGEYVQFMKDNNMGQYERIRIYLNLLGEIMRIVGIGVEIGIEMDDINRETLIVSQNAQNKYKITSESSIKPMQPIQQLKIFYDERQKQYNKIGSNLVTSPHNNKLYWSAQKIQNQILNSREYSTQQGQQSIYQCGLLLLDIIYEVERFYREGKPGDSEGDLRPDQAVLMQENVMSYYRVDREKRTVQRSQVLVSLRVNYLLNLDDQITKQLAMLLKSMIVVMAEMRPEINKILFQRNRLLQLLRERVRSKPETPMKGLQKNAESLKSIESLPQQAVHISNSQTLKNIESMNKFSSDFIKTDSLKYSQNSFNPHQEIKMTEQALRRASQNASPSPIPYRKEGNNPMSATTITSDANTNKMLGGFSGYESNKNPISYESPKREGQVRASQGQFINAVDIMSSCKGHHEGLRKLLLGAINQLQEVKKANTKPVIKKQYLDKSVYYGCVDQNSKREGLGIYIYKTGDIYFGIWKDNTLVNGNYLFKNGESFEGVVKNGKQGPGVYRYSNGNVYDGQWKDDLKNGAGLMIYPNGAKYEGQWLKGKKHGIGIYYYQNGIQYRGGFALGKKYGNGVFLFPNGTKVEGFWDNNHLEGLAKIFYQNGDYYQGNLHLSQKSGEGIYRWNNLEQGEIQYKGEFSKDNLDGFAIIKFKNGQVYEGKVKNGRRDGQGMYRYSNGDQFKGEWKNDHKQIGKYIFGTGDQFEGKFKEGQMAFGTLKYQNGQIYQGQFSRGQRHGVGTYSNKIGHLIYEGHWQRDEYLGPNKN